MFLLNNAIEPAKVLRMAGDSGAPLWYIDIVVFGKAFPALINTSIIRSKINHNFSLWLQLQSKHPIDINATEIILPLSKDGNIINFICDIFKPQVEIIELGMEYFKHFGYTFTFEGVTIDSDVSPISSHPRETNYVYNLKPRGYTLRQHLIKKRRFLKQKRNVPIANWPPASKPNNRPVFEQQPSSEESD